ncbi:MAG: PQQ-like beta-propeller repeat protein [Gemmataceae bacterium]|nr:PQQ-like beta-propeller repeat protein [Gemmataceae bacterium]
MRSSVRWVGVLAALAVGVGMMAVRASEQPPTEKVIAMVPAEGEAAKYWPRWRGPSGQGVVPDGDYPDSWSDKGNVLWKVPLPGRGNSSPIIFKDRLFLTTAYDKGKRRSILCLDRATGKQLWEAFAPDTRPEMPKDKNGWASGTPSTDGERVYAYFGNHGLLCVGLDGKQVWHKSFGEMDAYHGMACSPLLYRDRVILYQDHRSPSGSFVAAFDKKTGQQLWKTPRKESVGWGSPVAIRVGEREQIIVSSQQRVYAYDPDNGKQLWSCGGNLFEVTPTPVVGHGLLYCCSGRRGPTLAIRPDGSGDVTKSHVAWRTKTDSPFIPSPLIYGDYLYMVDDIVSLVTCCEAKTGKVMYRERLGQPVKHGFSVSPIGVNGKVFFTNDDGETFVLKAGPAFALERINRLNETTLASPALLDGRWYWRTERHLLCIGKGNP